MRPVVLLDVDGPLNPYAAPWFRSRAAPGGYEFHVLSPSGGRSYWVALDPAHGERLRRLGERADLAWATTWQDDANRLIAPLLGLPTDLAVVPLHVPLGLVPAHGWKTDQIVHWVGRRPFAWVDDQIDDQTRSWLDALPWLGPHLAQSVAPQVGLTDADFDAVEAFLSACS